MYLTAAYFVGDILVPNLTYQASLDNLGFFIAKHEPEFLKLLLGDKLYLDVITELAKPAPAAKYTELKALIYRRETIDGGDLDDVTIYYGSAANYVYFYWMRSNLTITTPAGEAQPKFENADLISSKEKMINAWNQIMAWVTEVRDFLDDNTDTFTLWGEGSYWDTTVYVSDPFTKINSFGI